VLAGKPLTDNPALKRAVGKMKYRNGNRHPPKLAIYIIIGDPMTNESAPLAIVYPIIVARFFNS